jgi:hypothetical protein
VGETRNKLGILVRINEGNRPHRRPWRVWKDDIKKDLKEVQREILVSLIWTWVRTHVEHF